MAPHPLVREFHLMDMDILVTRVRDQDMEDLGHMVQVHMDLDQGDLVDHLDNILDILVRVNIHPRDGTDQI